MLSTNNNWLVSLSRLLLFVLVAKSHSLFTKHCCNKESLTPLGTILKCCPVRSGRNASACCKDLGNNTIHLGVFMPYLAEDRFGAKATVLMAMDIINNRTDMLPGQDLVVHIADTYSGMGAKAILSLFRWMHTSPPMNMLIGPAFSKALQPVATAIVNWNILEIAYAAVAQKFSGFRYRNLYRIVPSSTSFNLAKVAFIKRFQWKRVAILHMYDAEVFSPNARDLQMLLEKNNITVLGVEGFQSKAAATVDFQLKKLKSLDARVILAEISDFGAQIVFCDAYKNKMYGSKYVWIVFGRIVPRYILSPKSIKHRNIQCTRDQLEKVMKGVFAADQLNVRQDNLTTISGLTSKQYLSELKKRNAYALESNSYIFDSMFTAVQTLGKAFKTNCPPSNFTYTSRSHMKVYSRLIHETKFEGISGPVRFNSTRDRLGTVFINQIQNESWEVVGQHFTYVNKLELLPTNKLWKGGRVPKDQMIRKDKHLLNDLTLIIVIWLLAVIGTLLSIAFLYFNISYKENRLIKMSSPQLNNVIILGCLLCYISVIMFGLDARFLSFDTYGVNCNVRTAVMSIGFSLAFGAMFSKTWRVHKIFTAAKTLKKMAIKDIHLFGIVAALVVVDLLYLSLWFGYDAMKAQKLEFIQQETTVNDVIYVPVLYQCTCIYKTYFIATLYAYKGILLLFGLFLAWETRNVTIPALNDSKYIGMSVYNVVTLSLIGAIVSTALDNTIHYEAPYAISSLCLIICTTATLLLVFVPKVYTFILGSEENSINTATANNGLTTTMGRNQSHAFRFDSNNDTKPRRYSTKGVQTVHHELTGDPAVVNSIDNHRNKINQGFELHMDDIELDDSTVLPKTRYNQQVTENGLVTLMLTDM